MKKILPLTKVLLLLAIVVLFAHHVIAGANPTATAPNNGGILDPVNVGSGAQTKTGGFWASSIGANADGTTLKGFKLGSNSGWVMLNGLTTVVAQRFCVGTYPTGFDANDCISSWTGGGASGSGYHFEYKIVTYVPHVPNGGQGYPEGYEDYCQASLSEAEKSAGWTSSGSDRCSWDVGHHPCDPSNKTLKCTDVRLISDATGQPVTTTVYPTVSQFQSGCAGGTPFYNPPAWNPTCKPLCDESVCGMTNPPTTCVEQPLLCHPDPSEDDNGVNQ